MDFSVIGSEFFSWGQCGKTQHYRKVNRCVDALARIGIVYFHYPLVNI